MRHLLSIDDLGAEGINEVLRLADSFVEVGARPIPKVPALRGKTVVSLFYEDSTRTRLSFETAAKRLSAAVKSSAKVAARARLFRPAARRGSTTGSRNGCSANGGTSRST